MSKRISKSTEVASFFFKEWYINRNPFIHTDMVKDYQYRDVDLVDWQFYEQYKNYKALANDHPDMYSYYGEYSIDEDATSATVLLFNKTTKEVREMTIVFRNSLVDLYLGDLDFTEVDRDNRWYRRMSKLDIFKNEVEVYCGNI